jgi:type IV secretion system protein VirD4
VSAVVFLGVAAFAGAVAVAFLRCTVFSGLQVRRMRWRTVMRVRPGAGFAALPELWWRWGRLAALYYGRRTRPDIGFWRRLVTPSTALACRLGRGPYFRRCYADSEKQTLYLAPPRKGKTGALGDRVIDHPGPALIHETRPDQFWGTAGYRARRGPVQTFNPDNLGGIPSTIRWAMTAGCDDPAEALYRAADLVGAVADTGEMQWWVEKAQIALAAGVHAAGLLDSDVPPAAAAAAELAGGLHAAALGGADMGSVWAWAYGDKTLVQQAGAHPAASLPLLGALTELDRPGKTADSVRITMSKALAWMAVPQLRDMVTGPAARPFDVPAWIDACGTIYVISPGGEQSPAAPLFRCLTSYMHRQAKVYAQTRPGRRLAPGPLFALDELDKCPIELPAWLADSGGSGIQIAAVVHSTGQLKSKYGEDGLDTVWSTAGVKIFLGGNHRVRTLQDISVLGGTLPGGEARGLNPVIPVEFLARLPNWRALVIADNLFPLVVKIRPYWRRTRNRLGLAPRPPVLTAPAAAAAAANGHAPQVPAQAQPGFAPWRDPRVLEGVPVRANGNGHKPAAPGAGR